MKKLICLLTALIILCLPLASCMDAEDEPEHVAPKYDEIDFSEISDLSQVSVSDTETDYVIIDVNRFGSIVIRLYPDVAPETVANFKKLVSEKFYDGIIFHRVIEGFMIQGGDPDGDGTGGSKDTIHGEFTSNGFANNLIHKRGVVSMARLGNDKDSASSQFFIMHKDYPSLNGDYASFGYVIYGMDVVDDIATVRTNSNDKPVTPVTINSIRFAKIDGSTNNNVNTDTSADKDNEHVAPTMDQLDFSAVEDISKVSACETETDLVIIDVKDMGSIVVRLYPDVAPETVANFKKLVSEKFYDGITFHRVIKNFVIQGGDPDGDGTGGSDKTIKGEFTANGFKNNLEHKRGVISMARLGHDYNSATSQFFIMHADYPSLNGGYASFGYVVYGMDVVDAIANVSTNADDKPLTDVVINSVRFATVAQ